jgi:hypothetical protein
MWHEYDCFPPNERLLLKGIMNDQGLLKGIMNDGNIWKTLKRHY